MAKVTRDWAKWMIFWQIMKNTTFIIKFEDNFINFVYMNESMKFYKFMKERSAISLLLFNLNDRYKTKRYK
jgi:hypothetical protein